MEGVVLTGIVEGRRARGRQGEKIMDGIVVAILIDGAPWLLKS